MGSPFDFTLGLDLRPQTTGAIQYALWLCETAELQAAGHIEAVHVIEPDAMVELIRYGDEQTILGAYRRRGHEILEQVAKGARLHAPEVYGGDAVELGPRLGLAQAGSWPKPHGRGPRGSTRLVVPRYEPPYLANRTSR